MSEEKDEGKFITEKLCESRRETMIEKIDGLKRTIYAVSAGMTIIILVVEFILSLFK